MLESLPPDLGIKDGPAEVPYNRNRLPVPGTLYNTNTLESFNALDKRSLLRTAADKVNYQCHLYIIRHRTLVYVNHCALGLLVEGKPSMLWL